MTTSRFTPEGNLQRAEEALRFAQVIFQKQDKEKETLCEMYHDQSTLVWNGLSHRTKVAIAKFYQRQHPIETTVQCLDAQICPPVGDLIDMITIIAGGSVKQEGVTTNFSRVFLIGPNSPGSPDYKIVSDNVRTQA